MGFTFSCTHVRAGKIVQAQHCHLLDMLPNDLIISCKGYLDENTSWGLNQHDCSVLQRQVK